MAEDTRSTSQIEADIAAARARLSTHVTELIGQIHPKVIVQKQKEEATTAVKAQVRNLKGQFVDENGLRLDRIVTIGGAVAGTVTFLLVVRGLVNRSKKQDD